jgi:hypothetical protein
MSKATISKNGHKNSNDVETTPRPELLDAIKATEATPKTLTARERCLAAAKSFAATGRQPILNEDAGDVANPKFRGDAQPSKNWAATSLKGTKVGDLTIDKVVEAATCNILDTQQGSLKLMEKGSVSVSVAAQRNVIFGKEASVALAGEFYTQCNRE